MLDALQLFLKRFRSGVRSDPVRDWIVLLTLSILAFVCIVVWNVWAFDTVARGGSIGAQATSTPAVFDRESIKTIHKVFEERAAEEAKYVTGVYRYADPSQ
jgi:hypothetical protein